MPIAALDIGSSKVCCLIARDDGKGRLIAEGIGHRASKGVRGGVIVDIQACAESIAQAVQSAERSGDLDLDRILVNLTARPACARTVVSHQLSGAPIAESDIIQMIAAVKREVEADDRVLIHAMPVDYSVDSTHGIHDPRGMYADTVSASMHLVAALPTEVRTLSRCMSMVGLEIGVIVAPAYASAIACLDDDEAELGAILVDLGAGTTSVAVFANGQCVYLDQLPVGGRHITGDIAQGLSIPMAEAEQLKLLFGIEQGGSIDEELIDLYVPNAGEGQAPGTDQAPRSLLVDMCRPRVEEILEMVRESVASSQAAALAGQRVILTGGGSQLPGLTVLAERILERRVRLAAPEMIDGLSMNRAGPELSMVAGMLIYGLQLKESSWADPLPPFVRKGFWGRMTRRLGRNRGGRLKGD